MSRRVSDSTAEYQLSLFLDQYFYPRLSTLTHFTYQRVTSRSTQLKGVDVIASKDAIEYYIDEKAQLYYINRPLETFAFEIDSIQNNVYRKGWLINDNLITNYYLLIWPYAVHNDLLRINSFDFTKLECLAISKTKITHFLSNADWDNQRLMNISKQLTESGHKGRYYVNQPDFYIVRSDAKKYSEAPTNVVICRKKLRELADAEYVVTPTSLERIK